MSVMRVFLFGSFRLTFDSAPSEVKVTHSIQALFAYLLLQRHRTHSREKLAGLFWGHNDEDRARSCLRSTLCRLRSLLEPEGIPRGTYLLTTPAGEIGFNRESDYWLDVAVFEEQLSWVLAQPIHTMGAVDAQKVESLQLYTGELLEGFYDDWVLRERERLRRLYLNSLAHLLRYYKLHGSYEEGLECGHRILNQDPLREKIHREVMRLYLESGQRALAVRQYEICRQILASELHIQPMQETQELYAQIVSEIDSPRTPSVQVEEPVCIHQALQQVRSAMQVLDDAQKQLGRAIKLVERVQVSCTPGTHECPWNCGYVDERIA